MKLEQQVVSLELAKKLKELGVKQESYAYWCWNNGTDLFPGKTDAIVLLNKGGRHTDSPTYCSAFTVAELGEMLPFEIGGKLLQVGKGRDSYWVVFYEANRLGFQQDDSISIKDQVGETEADARAKMLIYLLENKLITL